MTARRRLLLGCLAGIGLAVLVIGGLFHMTFGRAMRRIDERRTLLLERTDHKALLMACREVISKRGAYRVDPSAGGGDGPEDLQRRAPDPRDPLMPAAIRAVAPNNLAADLKSLRVELGGGFHHFGVLALAEGESDDHLRADPYFRQLTPGLWYYEDKE